MASRAARSAFAPRRASVSSLAGRRRSFLFPSSFNALSAPCAASSSSRRGSSSAAHWASERASKRWRPRATGRRRARLLHVATRVACARARAPRRRHMNGAPRGGRARAASSRASSATSKSTWQRRRGRTCSDLHPATWMASGSPFGRVLEQVCWMP